MPLSDLSRRSPAVTRAKCWNCASELAATALSFESLSLSDEVDVSCLEGGREGMIRFAFGSLVRRRLASLNETYWTGSSNLTEYRLLPTLVMDPVLP